MAHSCRLEFVTWRYHIRIPVGPYNWHRGCAPKFSKAWSVQCCLWYCALSDYKEPLKEFEIRVGHSPGYGLPFVAILRWLYRKRRQAIFIHIHDVGLRGNSSAVVSTRGEAGGGRVWRRSALFLGTDPGHHCKHTGYLGPCKPKGSICLLVK